MLPLHGKGTSKIDCPLCTLSYIQNLVTLLRLQPKPYAAAWASVITYHREHNYKDLHAFNLYLTLRSSLPLLN